MTSFCRSLLAVASLICAARALAQTVPTVTQALPARSLLVGGAAASVDLRPHFGLPEVTGTVVQFDTVMGRYNFELFDDTPQTKANFLSYVQGGDYNNTLIHRTVANFVVQGGGFFSRLQSPLPFGDHIPTRAPVQNEFRRSNVRGTVAMAKIADNPNSATSEWFVNIANNAANLDGQNGGFTVFARVIGTGMSVIDAIAALPRYDIDGLIGVPLRNVTQGQSVVQLNNLITVTNVSTVPIYPEGGASVISFSAQSSNPAVATAAIANSSLVLTAVSAGTSSITVRATDTNGSTAESTFTLTVTGGIAIAAQPQSQHIQPGASATLSVTAQAQTALSYQWRKNGDPIPGATNASYTIAGASAADMGFYGVTVSTAALATTSEYAAVTVAVPGVSRLVNVSTRGRAAAGEPLTPGFVVRGNGTKRLVVRAVGPALTQFGVSGVLTDPKMEIVPLGQQTVMLANDDWSSGSAADVAALVATSASVGAFGLSNGSKDAAVLATFNIPGASDGGYTVAITPAGTAAAGTALAEVYDADPADAPTRLINVSTRGTVTAEGLTPGFVISGSASKRLLIRAVGPSLASFGVPNPLADPTLTVVPLGKEFSVATNNDWSDGGRTPAVEADFYAAGAFRLPAGSRDAAVLVRLPPGAYTAVATGVNNTTGGAIVEVYDLDP